MLQLNKSNFNEEIKKGKVIIDLWAEWCIEISTKIVTKDNVKLANEIQKGDELLTYNGENLVLDTVKKSFTSKILGHCKEVATNSDRRIKVTNEHEFFTLSGWKKAEELKEGEQVAIISSINKKTWKKIENNLPKGLVWEPIRQIKEIYLESVQKITMNNNHNFIANGFLAHNCGPCRGMAPTFEALSKEIKDVKFAKLNVDENPEIASQFRVMSIPTFLLLKDGKEVDRIIGSMTKDALKSKIEATFKK